MPPTPTTDAAVDRPLPVCRRRDLVVQPLWFSQRRKWVVKDPLALAYYYFSDEEHAVVELLDGQASLAEIQTRFEQRFAPQRLPIPRLQAFVVELHKSGLV